jgi:phosphonate transport system substrate-binding protein
VSYQFALSPDVNVRDLSHWFVFNTRLQKLTGETLHLKPFDDFGELHRALAAGEVDLIFANGSDTAMLFRDRGFVPLVFPSAVSDEALIVVSAESATQSLTDLAGRPLNAAATDAPDVERICRVLLESVDLAGETVRVAVRRNPVLVAKAVLSGEAAAGFLLEAAFEDLSESTKKMLRRIAASRIHVVRHSLLAGPRLAGKRPKLIEALETISSSADDQALLEGLGAPRGWSAMEAADAELLVDVMEALED